MLLPLGCTQGDIFLADGNSPLEGRVVLCQNNAWVSVSSCDWDTPDAKVVCRQLGFSVIGEIYNYH